MALTAAGCINNNEVDDHLSIVVRKCSVYDTGRNRRFTVSYPDKLTAWHLWNGYRRVKDLEGANYETMVGDKEKIGAWMY